MLISMKNFLGYTVQAKDGEIGEVNDFFFEDDEWATRYMIVETGPWIFGKQVLISVLALGVPDPGEKIFPVELTRQQVKDSPDIDVQKPVTRRQEIRLHNHYGWLTYWGGIPGNPGSMVLGPPPSSAMEATIEEPGEELAGEPELEREDYGDPDLQSFRDVSGYAIETRDGKIGHLDDFLVDETWVIRYMIVDTSDWLPGKKVLVPPTWVERINTEDAEFEVDLARETIQNSPEYNPDAPVEREYERTLYEHYGRPKYWDE
jgi:hypothetical protein